MTQRQKQAGDIMKTYVLPFVLPLVMFLVAYGGEKAETKEKIDSLNKEVVQSKIERKEIRIEVKDVKEDVRTLDKKLTDYIHKKEIDALKDSLDRQKKHEELKDLIKDKSVK